MPGRLAENFRSPAALAAILLPALIGLALDLGTKAWAFDALTAHVVQYNGREKPIARAPYEFIPGWLHFTVTTNEGAVFGMGQGRRALFLLVSVGAVAFLSYLFATSGRQRLYQVILGMLMAGVLGNMYDRLRFGHVRDMIHALPGWRNPFPWLHGGEEIFPWIFNVADTLLCVGVGALVLYSLLYRPTPAEQSGVAKQERPA